MAYPGNELPIHWQESIEPSIKFLNWEDICQLTPRAMCLSIGRLGSNSYLLTILIQEAEYYEEIALTREELGSNLLAVRQRLDSLRIDAVYMDGGFDSGGGYHGDFNRPSHTRSGTPLSFLQQVEAFQTFIADMAHIGSKLYDNLFRNKLLPLDLLKEGDIIRIDLECEANDFDYPWAWLYHAPQDRGDTPDVSAFWGYRYILEIVPEYRETIGRQPPTSLISEVPFKSEMGFWNFAPETKNQRDYFANAVQSSHERLQHTTWEAPRQFTAALDKPSAHLYYFFSHGHTAMPHPYRDHVPELAPHNNQSYIKLYLGSTCYIYLNQLRAMDLRKISPLIFLNMCESAQVYPMIASGFVDVFLTSGARGVIGTEIPMSPAFADLFARYFFDIWFGAKGSPQSLGQALYELRRQFMDKKNPFGFAYTLYGDVTARLAEPLLKQKEE
ncbi:MAG TPA: CHAT domain-containing protein [Chthonomonadaceae bacterium]|nr:CHAT domain-containing protein [Chthonomonadaceae bacterium]